MLTEVHVGRWTIEEKDRVPHKDDYYDEYAGKGDTDIGRRLNMFRSNLTKAYRDSRAVLDIGVGDGAFLREVGGERYGYDVDLKAKQMLFDAGQYLDPWIDSGKLWNVGTVTFFDSLEHIPNFEVLLRNRLAHVDTLIVSIPIFADEKAILASKHYKPAEHIHYFTDEGFRITMEGLNRKVVYSVDAETQIGRDAIVTYVIKKA